MAMKEKSSILRIRVQPRAPTDRIEGFMEDGALKMRVAAPPEKGKANRSIIRLVAKCLGVKTSQVEIISGHTSGRKMIRIVGLDGDEVKRAMKK